MAQAVEKLCAEADIDQDWSLDDHIPNAETQAAMQEARDIMDGKIAAKWYQSLDEAVKDLRA